MMIINTQQTIRSGSAGSGPTQTISTSSLVPAGSTHTASQNKSSLHIGSFDYLAAWSRAVSPIGAAKLAAPMGVCIDTNTEKRLIPKQNS